MTSPPERPYRDRHDAGVRLAAAVLERIGPRPLAAVVLGLPRGGVPVAAPVAAALGAQLDVQLVRKLGAPGRPELALGAISGDGDRVLNAALVRRLGVDAAALDRITEVERAELARRLAAYRGHRPPPELAGRLVVLVDDGLATGATMRAAAAAVARHRPARLVLAAPVGAAASVAAAAADGDDVVVPLVPAEFAAVGLWYADFRPTTDDEVRALLAAARERRAAGDRGWPQEWDASPSG